MAKEVLEYMSLKQITNKSDVFSVGISLLEILLKIDLPKSGNLWTKLRSDEFDFESLKYKLPENMINLIKLMIQSDVNKRPTCLELLYYIPELNYRLVNLGNKNYIRSVNPSLLGVEIKSSKNNIQIKRIESYNVS